MAMRSQVYEWSNIVDVATNTSTTRRKGGRFGAFMGANSPTSVFIGGIGNNITKPANTSATQFVVIEDLACSPHLGASVQVTINTTDYFQTPDTQTKYADGTYAGIPGMASPYPRGARLPAAATAAPVSITVDTASAIHNSFNLYPSIYVLPGQTWDVKVALDTANGAVGTTTTGVAAAGVGSSNDFTSTGRDFTDGTELFVSVSAVAETPIGYYNVGATADADSFDLSTEQDATGITHSTTGTGVTYHENGDAVAAFVKYTLYDGPDALIANKLLEMGVTVNPNNVDWYKRTLIEQGGVA